MSWFWKKKYIKGQWFFKLGLWYTNYNDDLYALLSSKHAQNGTYTLSLSGTNVDRILKVLYFLAKLCCSTTKLNIDGFMRTGQVFVQRYTIIRHEYVENFKWLLLRDVTCYFALSARPSVCLDGWSARLTSHLVCGDIFFNHSLDSKMSDVGTLLLELLPTNWRYVHFFKPVITSMSLHVAF